MDGNTVLHVPRRDIDTVKRLGARWNSSQRNWYVPEGRDVSAFDAWTPPDLSDDGPQIPVEVVLLPDRCYRCCGCTSQVIGIWLDADLVDDGWEYGMHEECGGWLLDFDEETGDLIATACSDELLAENGAGPLRWCTTSWRPDGYTANTCICCGATLGDFPLIEAIAEFESEGGTFDDLPRIRSRISDMVIQSLHGRACG